MELWKAALLGAIQGLTEFFPVSSDGHLVAFERWLQVRRYHSGASFEAFLHVGTLLACLLAFRAEIGRLLALLATPRRLLRPAPEDTLGNDGRFILLGSIVTAAIAFPLREWFERLYDVPWVTPACLVLTSSLLLLSKYAIRWPSRPPNVGQPFAVGAAQAIAALPGLSRSASTVVVGLATGIPLQRVAGLSFLLSIPAVAGAVVLEFIHHPPGEGDWSPIAVGVGVAFVVGLFAVKTMIWMVPRGRMHWLAPWPLALAALVWLLP